MPPRSHHVARPELTIVSAGCTPVKGLRHLPRPHLRCDDSGPLGDREYCVVEAATGKILTTIRNPSLLALAATESDGLLEITAPDGRAARSRPAVTGERLTSDYWGRTVELELLDGPHDTLLSSWLDRPVRLARAPRGDIVFGAPVTVITTASVQDLGERTDHPDLLAEASRFRATLLVETEEPYVEDSWLGREIWVGDVRLMLGAGIPRCGVVDLDPTTGRRGGRLLKTLAGHRPCNRAGEPSFGLMATVLEGGAFLPRRTA